MKVYLDNVIVSATIRRDLASPGEQAALTAIRKSPHVEKLELVTSRESWREQDRAKDPQVRQVLRNDRPNTAVVANDHKVLGFNTQQDQYGGFITFPFVTDVVDEALLAELEELGLKGSDSRHLMYALSNGCDRFLTTDPDFLAVRSEIEARFSTINIVVPSELLAELSGTTA